MTRHTCAVRCDRHHLLRRCPGCLAELTGLGTYSPFEVPAGSTEYLYRAAAFYDMIDQQPTSAAEFVAWLAADLIEPASERVRR